jgi:hypothetical protein
MKNYDFNSYLLEKLNSIFILNDDYKLCFDFLDFRKRAIDTNGIFLESHCYSMEFKECISDYEWSFMNEHRIID